MRQLVLAITVAVLAIPASSATAHWTSPVKHCGSFKYGVDGERPEPGHITATNVSCRFARAVALLGPAPGWHCKNTAGLRFVCRRGTGVVSFYGE